MVPICPQNFEFQAYLVYRLVACLLWLSCMYTASLCTSAAAERVQWFGSSYKMAPQQWHKQPVTEMPSKLANSSGQDSGFSSNKRQKAYSVLFFFSGLWWKEPLLQMHIGQHSNTTFYITLVCATPNGTVTISSAMAAGQSKLAPNDSHQIEHWPTAKSHF